MLAWLWVSPSPPRTLDLSSTSITNLLCSSRYFQTSSSQPTQCVSSCTPIAPSASRLSSHDTLSAYLCSSRTSLYSLHFSKRWMARRRKLFSHDPVALPPHTATSCGNLLSLASWPEVSLAIAWSDSATSLEISCEVAAASDLDTWVGLRSRELKWAGTECLRGAPSESPSGAEVFKVS